MRKLIAAMNMTLDGFCDHTSMNADDELHEHYNDLLSDAGTLVYGRITYQLMEDYWPAVVKQPTGNKPTDEFAVLIDDLDKLVFSRSLKTVAWKNSTLATKSVKEEISALKQQEGKPILVGSPSLIVESMNLNLVDEFQFCVQPIVVGKGLQLFRQIQSRVNLRLINRKIFSSGSIVLYYTPNRED